MLRKMEDKIRANVLAIVPTPEFPGTFVRKYVRLQCQIKVAHKRLYPPKSWLDWNKETQLKGAVALTFVAEEVLTRFEELLYLHGKLDDRTQQALERNHAFQLECALNLRNFYASKCAREVWKP